MIPKAGIFVGESHFLIQGSSLYVQRWGRKEDIFYLLPLGNWTPCIKIKELENIFISHLQALNVHLFLASVYDLSCFRVHCELNISQNYICFPDSTIASYLKILPCGVVFLFFLLTVSQRNYSSTLKSFSTTFSLQFCVLP